MNPKECEVLLIDNTNKTFQSAASAYNYALQVTKGDLLVFFHQDVQILCPDEFPTHMTKTVTTLKDLGIAGYVGMKGGKGSFQELFIGNIIENGITHRWNRKIDLPVEVQTLDECALIVPRSVLEKYQFDEETCNGWHCYGIDYALTVQEHGLKAYVIPGTIAHNSQISNIAGLFTYQMNVFKKHQKFFKRVNTTCGIISALRLPWLFLKGHLINHRWFGKMYRYCKKRPKFLFFWE